MRRFAKFSVKRWVFRCFRNKRWRWQLSLRDLLQGKPTRFDARSRRGSATAIASRSSAMHWSRAWWRAGIHASLPCKCSRRSKASLDTDFPNRTRRVSRCWCTRAAGSNAIIPRRSRRRCSTVNRWGSTRRRRSFVTRAITALQCAPSMCTVRAGIRRSSAAKISHSLWHDWRAYVVRRAVRRVVRRTERCIPPRCGGLVRRAARGRRSSIRGL